MVVLLASDSSMSHDVAIATISGLISFFVAWLTTRWASKDDEKRAIREGTMRIIEWAVEYPFLESDAFCNSWPDTGKSPEDNLRYENFCCHVFNQIEHAWELFGPDERKMRTCLFPKELILRHRRWWQSDPMNQEAYEVGFRQFVDEIIRRADKGPKT